MAKELSERQLRVPVKYVDGRWEYWFGGAVPVESGAFGELIVSRDSIADAAFLNTVNERSAIKVLDAGDELLMAVAVKDTAKLAPELKRHLFSSDDIGHKVLNCRIERRSSGEIFFVRARLNAPTHKDLGRQRSGLWLLLQGSEPVGFGGTSVLLPIPVNEPLVSLNHGLTKLSEIYETWRIAHTGNVYKQVFYRETNGQCRK